MHEQTTENSEIIGMPKIKTTKVVYPQVYSYTLPDEPENEGSQKIGYTERKDVDKRIYEQTHTAAKILRSVESKKTITFTCDGLFDAVT